MTPLELIGCLREAGSVERCHTIQHHGSYSVGRHSWDAAALLLVLHPSPSVALVRAVLWHDVAERWTGDVPAIAKWDEPKLVQLLVQLEERVFDRLGLAGLLSSLSEEDAVWLDAVDKLELWLWANEQLRMGNRNAETVLSNLRSWFHRNEARLPLAVLRVHAEYKGETTIDGLLRAT